MNLISNCCIGGDYYNALHKEYNNPFIWVIIKPNDFINLLLNFDKLDFNKIEIKPSEFSNNTRKCFKIIIDNLVEVHYPHYLKDEKCKVIKHGSNETSVDVLFNNIETYILDTYKRRLCRMVSSNEKPAFLILGDRIGYEWTEDDIKELDKIEKYKICLITDKIFNYKFNNVHLIKFNSSNHYLARIKNDNEIRRFFNL